jgi:enoyl-CoA hydratase/carnithine racemase
MAGAVRRHDADGVSWVVIDRPERRNALSWPLVRELRAVLAAVRRDEAVRVVVLTGAGDRAFSAGADLDGMTAGERGVVGAHDDRGELAELFRDLWELGKPTIARVRGYALAGGFGLAMACDLVVAAEDAVFGAPEVAVGLWPFMITVPLLRAMPVKVALELMLTGRQVDAAEAARLGFVTRVVPVDRLDEEVENLARQLAARPPLAVRLGREAFYRALDLPADDALAYLQALLGLLAGTEDAAEGLRAFRERRAPLWQGR